jgi:hypothetical protein
MIFDLLYLEANLVLSQKPEENGPWDDKIENQRNLVKLQCLCKPAFLSMSAFVNKLWEGDDTGLTPMDSIKELLDLKKIEYRIFDDGMNTDTMPQLLVPPMTMKSATDYIHEKFGIFSGPIFRYANYAGQFCMWDLKKRWEMTKDSGFTRVHKMPGLTNDVNLYDDVAKEVSDNPDQFITYDSVETLHYGNSVMSKHAYDNIYISHPHEDLAYFHKWNADKIISDFGLWHESDKMKYHNELKHRKKYFYDWNGFETGDGYTGEYNDNQMTSSISELFKDSASLRFVVYRKVKVSLLSRVGEVIYMKPYSDHEFFPGSNYEGAYLITDTDIILTKESHGDLEDNIECFACVTAARSVHSKD